jgi:hypothetical protein
MADGSRVGWVAKYGVPSLVLSAAVLVLQQQQQTFDRLQRILESGYQFYSSGRTTLQYAGDGNRELSLLKIVGNAFPNVYCDVRQDMYERASKAETPGGEDKDGRKLIDSLEIRALYEGLADASRPRRREAADSVIGAWSAALPWASKESKTCPSLSNPSAEAQLVAESPPEVVLADANEPTAAPSPPPAAPAPAEAAGPDLNAKPGVGRGAAQSPMRAEQSASSTGPGSAPPPAPPPPIAQAVDTAPPPILTALAKPVRIFFHIPANSPQSRDIEILEGPRAELASYNYQVARSVERVPLRRFPGRPEIRYFGPDQAPAAEQLKTYLDQEFSAEGLEFRTKEIGADVKGFPPQNLEVWVPSPALIQ